MCISITYLTIEYKIRPKGVSSGKTVAPFFSAEKEEKGANSGLSGLKGLNGPLLSP
jgi:hypothetical protein